MHRTIWRTLVFVSVAVLLLVLRPALGAQGSSAAPQNAIPELLLEVRALRVAMEQMASAAPRVQLALGRLQLQEQRVNNLLRRQEATHAALVTAQTEYDAVTEALKRFDEAVRVRQPGEPGADEFRQRQFQLKTELTHATAALQRASADDAGLAAEIGAEQARWTDINQRLEELERTLTRK